MKKIKVKLDKDRIGDYVQWRRDDEICLWYGTPLQCQAMANAKPPEELVWFKQIKD